MRTVRICVKALRWLWHNRTWHDSRQKWKAFAREMRRDRE